MLGLAWHIRKRYGLNRDPLTDDDLAAILAGEGIEVIDCDMPGRLREAFLPGEVYLRRGEPRPLRRWLLCHALAHHLLDDGNQLHLDSFDRVLVRQQERRAEVFAGCLLLGLLCMRVGDVADLAERADVPVERVARWWELAGEEIQHLHAHFGRANGRARPPSRSGPDG